MLRKPIPVLDFSPTADENRRQIDLAFFADFIGQNNNLIFIEKSKTYIHNGQEIKFAQNLLLDPDINDGKKYFVISGTIGKGSYSRTRDICAAVTIKNDGTTSYEKVDDKVVRVRNTKKAQLLHQNKKTRYDHQVAMQEYQTAKPFNHLNMKKPITLTKTYENPSKDPALAEVKGPFQKSYSIVNKIPGETLDKEIDELYKAFPPSTSFVIKSVLLPIMKAYKKQIADKGYAHRDIKFENVNARILGSGTEINFLDMDTAKKIGEKDSSVGTLQFIPPESLEPLNRVAESRDIYALGVLLMGCINPMLCPGTYFQENTDAEAAAIKDEVLYYYGRYDPDALLSRISTPTDQQSFFDLLSTDESNVEEERIELKLMIESMTSVDPLLRPSTQQVIEKLYEIEFKLKNKEKIEYTSSSDSIASENSSASDSETHTSTAEILLQIKDNKITQSKLIPETSSVANVANKENNPGNKGNEITIEPSKSSTSLLTSETEAKQTNTPKPSSALKR